VLTSAFPYWTLAPNAFNALKTFTETIEAGSVNKKLLNLVYLRVSQINGCAYCTQLHGRDLRKDGETPERTDTLAAWKESPHFTNEERIALRWAELPILRISRCLKRYLMNSRPAIRACRLQNSPSRLQV